MYRRAIAVLLLGFALAAPVVAATKTTATKKKTTAAAAKKKKKPKKSCQPDLAHCPDQGCGTGFDPNLNLKKNLRPSDPATQIPVTAETLEGMKALANPVGFAKGDTREKLEAIGEGRKVSVVAFLLVVRDEPGGESCNCGLHSPAETDNHLVLVSAQTVDKFPLNGTAPKALSAVLHQREPESLTAEFTPRVRLVHPNFTKKKIDPLIDRAEQQALLVRVTGMLMFDSQHFFEKHLVRVNNWEIHPVLKMELCTTGMNCAASDTGWKSIDDLPAPPVAHAAAH